MIKVGSRWRDKETGDVVVVSHYISMQSPVYYISQSEKDTEDDEPYEEASLRSFFLRRFEPAKEGE